MTKTSPPPSPPGGRTAATELEVQAFGRKLRELMNLKGASASDLARHVWGQTTDKNGYPVARNRDRVSQYLRGKSYPERGNLEKIAFFFGVDPKVLAPEVVRTAARPEPAIQMTAIPGASDRVHLKINSLVSLSKAAQIIVLMESDPVVREFTGAE